MISKVTFCLCTAFLLMASMLGAQTPVPPAQYEPEAPPAELDRPLSGAQLQRPPESESGGRGMLDWGITASGLSTIDDEDTYSTLAISTDVDYSRSSERNDFTLRYAGGVLLDTRRDAENNTFHSLAFSETWALDRWVMTLGDTASYHAQSQGGGGAILGLGQYISALPFSNLNPNLLLGNSVVTLDTPQLSNSVFAQAQYNLSRATSATFVASYGLLRFLDFSAMNSNQWVFTTGLDHAFRRSRVATRYTYSRFSYAATTAGTEAHSAELMFARPLGRNVQGELSFGPQLILSHGPGGSSQFVPSGYAAISYGRRQDSMSLRYERGVNAGSGFTRGAIGDTVRASWGRQYRSWGTSVYGAYTHNNGLAESGKTISRLAEARLTRSLGRSFSAHVSYGYQSQSSGVGCIDGLCAFNGRQHAVGAGLTWHPRGIQIH